ncbi:MAG: ArsR/SmtB family transcription factor [Nocardioidaceae bacterium]
MDAVEVAKALASPTRVKVLGWLKDPDAHFVSRRPGDLSAAGVCASLIAQKAGVSAPTMSRHLDVLRRAELIETERIAGWSFHRRNPGGLDRAHRLLDNI